MAARDITQYIGQDLFDLSQLIEEYGRMLMNSIVISRDTVCLGTGLYVGLSVHSHSCSPDVSLRFSGQTAIMRSADPNQRYSTTLTRSFVELVALREERQRTLNDNYFIDCDCLMCSDDDVDGFSRSIKCSSCSDGVCVVTDTSTSLYCYYCSAASEITVNRANAINESILMHLRESHATTDRKNSLQISIGLYEKRGQFLSRLNIPLAKLILRIIDLSMEVHEYYTTIEFARLSQVHDTFRFHLPIGHPMIANSLVLTVRALSCQDPPPSMIRELLSKAEKEVRIAFGPPLNTNNESLERQQIIDEIRKKLILTPILPF